MIAAVAFGSLAASSLLVGALLGVWRAWSDRLVGLVLAFGGGALMASIAFELAEEGVRVGGPVGVGVGLALGALAYFLADRALERATSGADSGSGLALGAFLDGIPEQLVLGIGLAAGGGVSAALLVAIFVSNLPESIGSATDMRRGGTGRGRVLLLWLAVSALCAAATVAGFAVADRVGGGVRAGVDGFAAGALLVMLVDSMIPEAQRKGRDAAGLVTVLGFAVGAALSLLGG